MTPLTTIIDKEFRGVGRISRASGTTNPSRIRKYKRMLDQFRDDGRVELLRSIRDGHLTFAECYEAYQRGKLGELATGNTATTFTESYARWRQSVRVSDQHRASLGTSGDYLTTAAPKARVVDLPAIVRDLHGSLGVKHPRSYNLARSAVLAFLRDTLTRAHPLYLATAAIPTQPIKAKRLGRPFDMGELARHFPRPESHPVDAIAWGMATTGMGTREYWGHWFVIGDKVRIEGTKRDGRRRDIPLIARPAVPTLHQQTFAKKFRERVNGQHQVYDLRRTYANALEDADIPRTRRRLYMGHGAGSVTDLYEHRDVRKHLAADALKLRAVFAATPAIRPTMAVKKTAGK